MFSIATTCVVLVFLSSANRLGLTKIVKNSYEQELITEDGIEAKAKNLNEWDRTLEILHKQSHCDACKEVQNLEIYATDESSISMRYDLPNNTINGPIPTEIQIIWCEYDKKSECKYSISNITRCSLFPAKYCADIKNLVNNSKYLLKISLRNDITPTFGLEKEVVAEVLEKVPGRTEKIMATFDCPDAESCILNIILDHPYNQNGSITAFNIVLYSSETVNNVTDVITIQEIFKIYNKNYLPQYHYQIKYVPYRKMYILYIQAENLKYKSDFAMFELLDNRNANANIHNNPMLLKTTEDSFTFRLSTFPHMQFPITIIVQDYDDSQKVESNLLNNYNRELCLNHGNTWIANVTVVEPGTVTISQDIAGKNRLISKTKYCVTILIRHLIVEHNLYFENLELLHSSDDYDSEPNTNDYRYRYISFISLFILIVTFVIIILGGIFVVRFKMRKPKVMEHEYEDMEDNYNEYDHLSHK